jgi:hypothetical protein
MMESLRNRFKIEDVEVALEDAITLARAGEKAEASFLLEQVVELVPENELAWRWLAWCATSKEERIHALQQVLAINPSNKKARRLLADMQETRAQMVWELRNEKYVRAVVIGVVVLLVLGPLLSWGLGAYRESRRRNLEAAVSTSEAAKVEAMRTATARAWIVPTWTPGPTRTPRPTSTRVVQQTPEAGAETAPAPSATASP